MAIELSPQNAPYWSDVFIVSRGVHTYRLGQDLVLYCEQDQKLYGLNPTSAHIWADVVEGQTSAQISTDLKQAGLDLQQASAFVHSSVSEWMTLGFVMPKTLCDLFDASPREEQPLRIGNLHVCVRIFGHRPAIDWRSAFHQFFATRHQAEHQIDIASLGNNFYIKCNRSWIGLRTGTTLVPEVKAQLTALFCDHQQHGFVSHGALLSRNNQRYLFCGPPGAGKSTLALALAQSGWTYHGDDVILVDADGSIAGIPFAAASKSGAWKLLDAFYPNLQSEPVHERQDGQSVKYLLPPCPGELEMADLTAIIILKRGAIEHAQLTPNPPLRGLLEIIENAYAKDRMMNSDVLQSLIERLKHTLCYSLEYATVDQAIETLEAMC